MASRKAVIRATVTTTDKEGTELKKEPSSEVQWDKNLSNPVKTAKSSLMADQVDEHCRCRRWLIGWMDSKDVKNTDNVDITLSDGSDQPIHQTPYIPAGSAKNYTVTYYTTAPTDSLSDK